MKLLYFSQFYLPEQIAPAFRASENARIWSKKGHDITVFTGYPNYPVGKIFDGYEPRLLTEETDDGVRVLRSKIIAKPNTNMIRRVVNALSFFGFGCINILFNRKKVGKGYDVVLGTSGTIFAALLGWVYAFLNGIPFAFEIRDITYRQMIATGKSADSLGVKGMRFLELFLAKRAKTVVVVTNGFKDVLVADGIPEDKIHVITNGVDVEQKDRTECDQESLVLSYFGTLGISQNIMDTFPYADEIAKLCSDFSYLIIGEGAQRQQIEEAAASGAIPYLQIKKGMTMQELEPYYEESLLSLICLRKSDNFRYTIPSKLFQVMGRGVAVLFIGPEGESAEIIRKNHAGIVLSGSMEEDMEVLRNFFGREDWKQELIRMGKNGAEAVQASYTRTALAEQYEKLLLDVSR